MSQTSAAPGTGPKSAVANPSWETVTGSEQNVTERLRVPGGYIYSRTSSPNTPGEFAVALVFVPQVPGEYGGVGGAGVEPPLHVAR
jgi:hypothetical protein